MDRREFMKIFGTGFLSLYLGNLFNYCPYVQHGDKDSGKIAITIDDGWYREKVEDMFIVLNGAPASLFIVGSVLDRDADLYREIVGEGYRLYNHTWDHKDLNGKGVNVLDEILWWEEAYENLGLGQFRNKALRLPGLSGVNNPGIFKAAARLGYEAIFGCTWGSRGVYGDSADSIVESVLPYLYSGSILLFHFVDDDIEAMPYILEEIRKKHLTPVGLHHLPSVPIYEKPVTRRYPGHYLPRR